MNVFFNDITCMGMPLVWAYNEKTNQAVCLFITTAKGQKYNKASIIKELGEKKYPGISLSEDSAIIDDYSSFIALHSVEIYESRPSVLIPKLDMQIVEEQSDQKERKTTLVSSGKASSERSVGDKSRSKKGKQEGFDGGVHHVINPLHALLSRDKSSESTTASSEEPAKKTTFNRTRSSSALPRNSALSPRDASSPRGKKSHSPRYGFHYKTVSYDSILIEHLIIESEHPDVYRDTLSHKGQFSRKTAEDRSQRTATYLRNIDSFKRELQYVQNDNLHPTKGEIIVLLERLFEKELNPAYQEWKKKEGEKLNSVVLKELFNYLRNAVHNTMLNAPSDNNQPTEYELLSVEQRLYKFRKNDELYKFANYKIREARTSIMMINLSFLIDAACPIELTSSQSMSTAATDALKSFKQYVTQDTERVARIKEMYGELQSLLIKSGEIEWSNLQLTHALDSQLVDKDQRIGIYSSLIGKVRATLIEANKKRKKPIDLDAVVCHQFADKVVTEVVRLLVHDEEFKNTPYIEKLKKVDRHACPNVDEDIYLSQEWIIACDGYLPYMDWDKILKHISDAKKSAAEVDVVAKKLCEVIKLMGMALSIKSSHNASSISSDAVVHSTGEVCSSSPAI